MATVSEVERLYEEMQAIKNELSKELNLSIRANFEVMFAKSLLLASASYFEKRIAEILIDCFKSLGNNEALLEFVNKHALKRKYHTMFDWKSPNLNQFFALFGENAKNQLNADLKENQPHLNGCISAFIYLNSQRNALVHDSYASFNLDTTAQEIWERFKQGVQFCEWLNVRLRSFSIAAID